MRDRWVCVPGPAVLVGEAAIADDAAIARHSEPAAGASGIRAAALISMIPIALGAWRAMLVDARDPAVSDPALAAEEPYLRRPWSSMPTVLDADG